MSDTPRKYNDAGGNEIALFKLVRKEPDWAVNQILHRDKLERELSAAQAECAELKYGNAELIKHRNELQATCSNWDKALSSLAAMVMRYFKSINYRTSGNGDVADDLYYKCNKRGDDERELVNECAKLREERDALRAIVKWEPADERNMQLMGELTILKAVVRDLLAAIDNHVGRRTFPQEVQQAAAKVREVMK